MGCTYSTEKNKTPNQNSNSNSNSLQTLLSKIWNYEGGRLLAEIENQSSNKLLFVEKNREVWKSSLFELEPQQKMRISPHCQLVNGTETFACVEVLVVNSKGERVRAVNPIFIEPYELVRYKQIIIQGTGRNLKLKRVTTD